MRSCAIFGHGEYLYEREKDKIEKGLIELIERCAVAEFYLGMRGKFDVLCVEILRELKKKHPQIHCTRVWAYIPQNGQGENGCFDSSVYLLEKRVPPAYAIIETNKCMVQKADYIFSGVVHAWGGAWTAVEYAKKQGKKIIEPLRNECR